MKNLPEPKVRAFAALIAIIPALIKAIYYPHNIGSDDAYIHFRVASDWARGLGWGINPHEAVNLSTGPAFTLLLAFFERISSHPLELMQCLSVIATSVALLLIFATALAETGSVSSAFVAEIGAAFSVNLWRWNGTVMETSFAMTTVALTLFLVRRGRYQSATGAGVLGLVLGIGVLLRPEMFLLLLGAGLVMALRSEPSARILRIATLCLVVAAVLLPWVVFAQHEAITVLPTTFTAKSSSHLLLLNSDFAGKFGESLVESVFFPILLIVILAIKARRRSGEQAEDGPDWRSYVLPLIWTLGVATFYYLKMPQLQSPGRYLLPLLPCEALLLGLLWRQFAGSAGTWEHRLTTAFLVLHVVFAFAFNQHIIAPVLARFESEYGSAMRGAADELSAKISDSSNKRVLVVVDIGVLSCEGDGRFEIFDGGALATPSLRGLTVREQIEKVKPAYVVQSQTQSPEGFGPSMPDLLQQVWERKFQSLSVQTKDSALYTIIYKTDFE